jgi:hypothetical protein
VFLINWKTLLARHTVVYWVSIWPITQSLFLSHVSTKCAFPRRKSLTNFFIIRLTRCTNFANLFLACNSTSFGECLCPSSGVHSLYTQHWYISYKYVDSLRVGSEWNWFYSVAGGWIPNLGSSFRTPLLVTSVVQNNAQKCCLKLGGVSYVYVCMLFYTFRINVWLQTHKELSVSVITEATISL